MAADASALAAPPSKGRTIAYWVTTALVVFAMGAGGVADVLRPPDVVASIAHLGYPPYFPVLLGAFKIAGAIVVVAPGLRRLKEWAYAGIVIDLVAAAVSHVAVGDGAGDVAPPVVLLAVTAASHQLRPPQRMLAD
ncbi:MAG: DoxX family protein [Myxococcota bacterium]